MSNRRFKKYHALGNSYIVVAMPNLPAEQLGDVTRELCDLCIGIGADGVLFGPTESPSAEFGFDIYNPDGSRAEISGNGARIFARYLFDERLVEENRDFKIGTDDRTVTAKIIDGGQTVAVDMGQADFNRVNGVIQSESLTLKDGKAIEFYRVSVGNPHCVTLTTQLDQAFVHEAGSQIEVHPLFPEKTNVQFVQVVDNHSANIEIWERGAGYTLSSGSSSTAVAAVLMELGLCQSPLTINMPGGQMHISRSDADGIIISGPVVPITEGTLLGICSQL